MRRRERSPARLHRRGRRELQNSRIRLFLRRKRIQVAIRAAIAQLTSHDLCGCRCAVHAAWMTPCALSIAGSDPSGGAGIQADLKTFHTHRVFGMAVVSLLTVQNTRGVRRVERVAPELVAEQICALLDDVAPAAIKTGAIGGAAQVEAVAAVLAQQPGIPLVVDPVCVSKTGAELLDESGRAALMRLLLPRAALITPQLGRSAALTRPLARIACRDRRGCAGILGPRSSRRPD